jgi:transposase-like protein
MTKAEQARQMAWRFKVLQQAAARSRNIARTCRHFGISRQAFYRWKRRFDAHGAAGLSDRPSTPHRSPTAMPREVVSKILYLRQHYHFGPGKIADYLKRFHQLHLAVSSVHRTLVRHGLNRLPANQKHRARAKRWQRYEKPQPGHRLQMDVKFLERIPGTRKRLYQFTAIDDCTRIRVLKVYDACNQGTAIRFMDDVLTASGILPLSIIRSPGRAVTQDPMLSTCRTFRDGKSWKTSRRTSSSSAVSLTG